MLCILLNFSIIAQYVIFIFSKKQQKSFHFCLLLRISSSHDKIIVYLYSQPMNSAVSIAPAKRQIYPTFRIMPSSLRSFAEIIQSWSGMAERRST